MSDALSKLIVDGLTEEVEDSLERSRNNRAKNYGDVSKNNMARNYYAGKIDAYEEFKILLKIWREILKGKNND